MHCRLTTLAFALLATLAATTVPAITMARPMTPTGELPRAATLTHAVSGGYLENHAAGVPRMTLVDDDNDKDNDDNDDYENDSTNEADLIDWNRFSLHRHSPNSATSATASIPPTIPRIVWTFWESEASMPAVVRACVENMRRLNQGWHVQLLVCECVTH